MLTLHVKTDTQNPKIKTPLQLKCDEPTPGAQPYTLNPESSNQPGSINDTTTVNYSAYVDHCAADSCTFTFVGPNDWNTILTQVIRHYQDQNQLRLRAAVEK
jgi:hypothetical protein